MAAPRKDKGKHKPLSLRGRLFVQYLLADPEMNQGRAAEKAGFNKKGARVQAARLMKHPEVIKAVDEAMRRRQVRTEITQDMVVRELAAVAFSDPRRLFDNDGTLRTIRDLDDETAASLAGIENEEIFEGRGEDREHIGTLRKIKRWDKVKALELLGRHLGMFNDKLNLGNADGEPLQIELVQFGGDQ